MYERCLNEAERLLATSKEVVLPIKDVWRLLAAEGKRQSFEVPALTDFDALLEGDKRFEILSAQTEPEEIESIHSEEGDETDSNLGTLGFYLEDRVKLRRLSFTGTSSNRTDRSRTIEDDEDVVPLNVKGLSATKPGHLVDKSKQPPKKTPLKAPTHTNTSSRTPVSKKSDKSRSTKKTVKKKSHRTR